MVERACTTWQVALAIQCRIRRSEVTNVNEQVRSGVMAYCSLCRPLTSIATCVENMQTVPGSGMCEDDGLNDSLASDQLHECVVQMQLAIG